MFFQLKNIKTGYALNFGSPGGMCMFTGLMVVDFSAALAFVCF